MKRPNSKTFNPAKLLLLTPILLSSLMLTFLSINEEAMYCDEVRRIKLPAPKYKGKVSVEEAIYLRKSIRQYKNLPLKIEQVGQLLWSACGVTIDGVTGPTRAYPSAGAIYPIKIYLVVNNVLGLEKGIYLYIYNSHELQLIKKGDFRGKLLEASYNQFMVSEASINIILTGLYNRVISRYGERGERRYICMDVGHAGQNIHLQCVSLGLGTVVIGAFDDVRVAQILELQPDEKPLYIMPVGVPKR